MVASAEREETGKHKTPPVVPRRSPIELRNLAEVDLKKENAPEEIKLQVCEAPFIIFYAKVVIVAFHEQARKNNEKVLGLDATSSHRLATLAERTPDLSLEAIKAECDWYGEVRKRSLRVCASRAWALANI